MSDAPQKQEEEAGCPCRVASGGSMVFKLVLIDGLDPRLLP